GTDCAVFIDAADRRQYSDSGTADMTRITWDADGRRLVDGQLAPEHTSEPHVVGTDAPTPENDPAGRFRPKHDHRYEQFATFHRAPIRDPYPAHTSITVFVCFACGDWYMFPEENGRLVRDDFLKAIAIVLIAFGDEEISYE